MFIYKCSFVYITISEYVWMSNQEHMSTTGNDHGSMCKTIILLFKNRSHF